MMSSNRNRVPGAPNLDPADPNALIPVQPAPVPVPAPAPVVNAEEADIQPQMSTKDIFKQLAKATGAVVVVLATASYRSLTFGPDGTLWLNLRGEQPGKNKFDGSFINPQSNPNANPYSNPYTSRHAPAVAGTTTPATTANSNNRPHS